MGLSNIQIFLSVYERGRERDDDSEKQVRMAKRGASAMASMLGNKLRDSCIQNKTIPAIELTLRVQTSPAASHSPSLLHLVTLGKCAAVELGAFADESETPEAFVLSGIRVEMTKPIIARGVLFGGRQAARRNVETAAIHVFVQGKGALPCCGGGNRLPKLITEKFRLWEFVALLLADFPVVGRLVLCRALLFGPAPDLGCDTGENGLFADLVFLRLAAWKRIRCSEQGGDEEDLSENYELGASERNQKWGVHYR